MGGCGSVPVCVIVWVGVHVHLHVQYVSKRCLPVPFRLFRNGTNGSYRLSVPFTGAVETLALASALAHANVHAGG